MWRWTSRTLAALGTALVVAALYGAYGYTPAVARDYDSPYLATIPDRFVETPIATFHYVRMGSGPPVVLIPPGGMPMVAWRYQLPALAHDHSVYVVELPGQGYTAVKDDNFSWDLDGMTRALASFLDVMGIQRTALVGNSWSGGWALAFAQRHPRRVSKLALLGSSGLQHPLSWTWRPLTYPVVGRILAKAYATKAAVRYGLEAFFYHHDVVTDQLAREVWAPMTREDNWRAWYRLTGMDWSRTEQALPRTRTPALVIWGRQDEVLPATHARQFGKLLPNARVHLLDRCGHVVEMDCPVRVNDLLREFL